MTFTDKDHLCNDPECKGFKELVVSVDFNIHIFKVPSCWFDKVSELQLYKLIIKHQFNRDVYSCRGYEKWDGGDKIMEKCFLSQNNFWGYYIETELSKASNIFCLSDEFQRDVRYKSSDAHYLIEENLGNLKRDNFVSKRANPYEVTLTDINVLINKINSYEKRKNSNKQSNIQPLV